MAEAKKGHKFVIQGPTEKRICVRLFFVRMLYIKFQVPSSSRSLVLQPTTMFACLGHSNVVLLDLSFT